MHTFLALPLLLTLLACEKDEVVDDSSPELELCDDGADNDSDGDVDCDDSDCFEDAACQEQDIEADCDDGIDNDSDGDTDCDDSDCATAPACEEEQPESDCADGLDNDGDGDTDCDDSDCEGLAVCLPEGDCADGEDNDSDGLTDCEDADCSEQCTEDCGDGVDNDADGFVDCFDSECNTAPECDEDCADGVDNDSDGLVDCEDGDCSEQCSEDCEDSVDNDADGYVDCQDDECWGSEACSVVRTRVISWESGHGSLAQTRAANRITFPSGAFLSSTTSGFENSAEINNIQGTAQFTDGSGSFSCTWTVDKTLMGRQMSAAGGSSSSSALFSYYGLGMDLIARSGFQTSGGCGGLTSDVLPQQFGVAYYYGIAATSSSRFNYYSYTGPLWYAGGLTVSNYNSTFGSTIYTTSAGASVYSSTRQVSMDLDWTPSGSGGTWESAP